MEKFCEEALAFSDLDEFKKKYNDAYDDNSQPYLLYKYLFSLKKGDVVLINDGKKRIVGKGILSSETYYADEPQESYYHNIDWKETDLNIPIPTDLKGKFSRRVVELTKNEYERLMKETGVAETMDMTMLEQLLERKKQVIIYGPPGTGKTYKAKHYIDAHSNRPSDANVHSDMEHIPNTRFVTFHPSFAYEDFIEGLRPETDDEGCIHYRIEDGVFKGFAQQAFNVLLHAAEIDKKWAKGKDVPELSNEECNLALEFVSEVPFYLIIDEINRGDISRIFGELITLLEADKRLCEKNCLKTTLPYSKKRFGIPPNLFIIGTMNTADKSISLVDIALRRRFGFLEMMPDSDVLRTLLNNDDPEVEEIFEIAIAVLEEINEAILEEYDRDHQIGHSYFVKLADEKTPEDACESLRFVWYYEVLPLLQEYFYDSPKKLAKVIGKDFVTLHSDGRSFMFTEPIHGDVFLSALKKLAKMDNSSGEDEEEPEEED
ncbi:MAG: AAA domain-containing protein [Methanomicrobiales archaeon]|nr:AAA domain-containing protein [Methanomicrobiales archaeon]